MDETRKVGERLIYQGKIISINELDMEFGNGNTAKWDFIHHHGACAVVAVTDSGKLLMEKQYRPGCDGIMLEIPAGCIEPGEERIVCAARELEEETGYRCTNIELITQEYPAPAYDDEYIEIFLATGLVKTERHLDENEFIDVLEYDIEELVQMVLNREIQDAKTIIGILTYYTMIKRR